ncbi:MAG: Superoxide dismutase [Cu-Zn] [Marteilia pararefringens]
MIRCVAVMLNERNEKCATAYLSQESHGKPLSIDLTIKKDVLPELFGEYKELGDTIVHRGLHIHQAGDSTRGCASAGPHFNPHNTTHGGLTESDNTKGRHAGDFGNIAFNAAQASYDSDFQCQIVDENPVASLDHRTDCSVIGRSLVLHAARDDLGLGEGAKQEESLKTGNAGARYCCGVIALCL